MMHMSMVDNNKPCPAVHAWNAVVYRTNTVAPYVLKSALKLHDHNAAHDACASQKTDSDFCVTDSCTQHVHVFTCKAASGFLNVFGFRICRKKKWYRKIDD